MDTKMHGKKIKKIVFDGASSYQIMEIWSDEERQLALSATHHGDHDEFWVTETIGGRETRRFTTRLIETIEWQPESEE